MSPAKVTETAGNEQALVLELGGNNTRFGFAGDDRPRIRMPSYFGAIEGVVENDASTKKRKIPIEYRVGEEGLRDFNSKMHIRNIYAEGAIKDWDVVERILRYAMVAAGIDIDKGKLQTPVLIAESVSSTISDRKKMTELLFQKFSCPGVFFSRAPVLSCYASARSTGIVLDLGATHSRSSVVQDGFLLQDTLKLSETAGNSLANVTLQKIRSVDKESGDGASVDVIPDYAFTKSYLADGTAKVKMVENLQVQKTYERYFQREICKDFFQKICCVDPSTYRSDQKVTPPNKKLDTSIDQDSEPSPGLACKPYKLPDGTQIETKELRYSIPEKLFEDSTSNPAIHKLVMNSASLIGSVDLRKEALGSIVLCGGLSSCAGIPERLQLEMTNRLQKTSRPRVIVAKPDARKNLAWIGGSIVASLGDFRPMFISKEEYNEEGSRVLEKKCP